MADLVALPENNNFGEGGDIISASDAICLYTAVLHFARGGARAAWAGMDVSVFKVRGDRL